MRVPGIENNGREPDSLCYGGIDQFLRKLYFAFEEMYGACIEFFLPFIKPEVYRKILTLGNKGRGYEDIADRLVAQGSTVLITGPFGFFRVNLRTAGIIDHKNSIRRRCRRSLTLYTTNPFIIYLFVIPLGLRKEILEVLVVAGGNFSHDLHIVSFYILEKKIDIQAEVEELPHGEMACESDQKLVDQRTGEIENTHILCSLCTWGLLSIIAYCTWSKGVFIERIYA